MTDVHLAPCPFCGSTNIDPEGWVSTERKGPACDDCNAAADTVELWNRRPNEDRLRNLVKDLIENDPHESVADGGITVLDVWRKDAKRLLAKSDTC